MSMLANRINKIGISEIYVGGLYFNLVCFAYKIKSLEKYGENSKVY